MGIEPVNAFLHIIPYGKHDAPIDRATGLKVCSGGPDHNMAEPQRLEQWSPVIHAYNLDK